MELKSRAYVRLHERVHASEPYLDPPGENSAANPFRAATRRIESTRIIINIKRVIRGDRILIRETRRQGPASGRAEGRRVRRAEMLSQVTC